MTVVSIVGDFRPKSPSMLTEESIVGVDLPRMDSIPEPWLENGIR